MEYPSEGVPTGYDGRDVNAECLAGRGQQQKPHIQSVQDVRLVVWRWMMVNVFLFNVSVRELDPEPETERKWHRSNSP